MYKLGRRVTLCYVLDILLTTYIGKYQIIRHATATNTSVETFPRGRSHNLATILQYPLKRLVPFFPRKFRMTIGISSIEGKRRTRQVYREKKTGNRRASYVTGKKTPESPPTACRKSCTHDSSQILQSLRERVVEINKISIIVVA